jgi:hypothetical protein
MMLPHLCFIDDKFLVYLYVGNKVSEKNIIAGLRFLKESISMIKMRIQRDTSLMIKALGQKLKISGSIHEQFDHLFFLFHSTEIVLF